MCGVSRATVDRVLNNRGKVKADKRELILSTAKRLNYRPNPAGRALITRKKKPTVAIIMPSIGLCFFDDIIDAMEAAEEKYSLFGLNVVWKLMKGYDVERMAAAVDDVRPKVNAVIINPINHPKVIEAINRCIDAGVFVVTVNNDVEQAKHHYYVGTDYYNGGQTAAGLMKLITRGQRHIAVTLASRQILGHKQRLQGFYSVLEGNDQYEIIDILEDDDDDFTAFDKTKTLLVAHPDINTIFMAASGGAYGVCRAVLSLGRAEDITIITFDTLPGIVEMMEKGVVDAAIYQHPRQQGSRSMRLVYDYLLNGIEPPQDRILLQNEIRILENVKTIITDEVKK